MSWRPRIIATGLRFPEGPSYLGGGAVAVAEMKGEAVSRVDPDGSVVQLGDCGGAPNGTVLGADEVLYVANNGGLSAEGTGYWHAPRQIGGCVQRVAGAEAQALPVTLPGPAPHRPNDLCFGPDGTLYVTDSANWEELRNIGPGRVVAIDAGPARPVAEVAAMPNGIAFGPDGTRLYLAQSLTRKILAFDVRDGALGDPVTFCKLPAGMPDGFCLDSEGNLYVCGSIGNAIFVYASDGTLKETVETGPGSQPTNCCIGDGVLYVTFSLAGQLVAYDLSVEALALHRGGIRADVPPGLPT
jgi:gluconolactonase